jgi:hypothetical protein
LPAEAPSQLLSYPNTVSVDMVAQGQGQLPSHRDEDTHRR